MDTKAELVAAVAAASGVAKVHVEGVLNAFRDVLHKEVGSGGEVWWPEVGRFVRQDRKGHRSVHVGTGVPQEIAPYRVAKFIPSQAFTRAVRS